jgi:hypothetical protein
MRIKDEDYTVRNMRQRMMILLAAVLIAASAGGCAKETSGSPSDSLSPIATGTPVPTTAPDIVEASASASTDEDAITVNGWTYYLDEEDAATVNYGEDPPLHRKNEDGSDENMGLRGFGFDIIGEYIYLDASYSDLDENGNQTWYTTRVSLDGSSQRRLEYGSMSARVVAAQKFYFTVAGDSAIYASDFSCENVAVLLIALPDESEFNTKLDSNREMQLDIDTVEGGWINFAITFITPEGIQMYKGNYKMSENGSGIEKISGTYYDYKSMQSDLD